MGQEDLHNLCKISVYKLAKFILKKSFPKLLRFTRFSSGKRNVLQLELEVSEKRRWLEAASPLLVDN